MPSIITLPFIALIVISAYGALIKLVSTLYRRTQLSWKNAIIFGLIEVSSGAFGELLRRATERQYSVIITFLFGFGLQLGLGGWFLSSRAKTSSSTPISFTSGLLLSLATYALVLVFGGIVMFFLGLSVIG